MDESGEVRATAFKDQCDQYYDMIQVQDICSGFIQILESYYKIWTN